MLQVRQWGACTLLCLSPVRCKCRLAPRKVSAGYVDISHNIVGPMLQREAEIRKSQVHQHSLLAAASADEHVCSEQAHMPGRCTAGCGRLYHVYLCFQFATFVHSCLCTSAMLYKSYMPSPALIHTDRCEHSPVVVMSCLCQPGHHCAAMHAILPRLIVAMLDAWNPLALSASQGRFLPSLSYNATLHFNVLGIWLFQLLMQFSPNLCYLFQHTRARYSQTCVLPPPLLITYVLDGSQRYLQATEVIVKCHYHCQLVPSSSSSSYTISNWCMF